MNKESIRQYIENLYNDKLQMRHSLEKASEEHTYLYHVSDPNVEMDLLKINNEISLLELIIDKCL